MSDPLNKSESQSAESGRQPFVTIPKTLIEYVRSLKLTGTQYDLWLYLYELDPYGDRWIEIPPPDEIATLLRVDPRTIQRAAQRLDDCQLFEFQIKRWRARNTTIATKSRNFSTGKEIRMRTKRSKSPPSDQVVPTGISLPKERQNDPDVTPKTFPCKPSESLQTLQTDQTFSESKRETFEEEEKLPKFPLFEWTGDHSFKLTSAYENWLRQKAQQLPTPPVLIERWIESAAILEANQRQFLQEFNTQTGINIPPLPPDRFQVESACTSAMLTGDRTWVLDRLQQLWDDGWHDLVEDLMQLYPGWGLMVTETGVKERNNSQ